MRLRIEKLVHGGSGVGATGDGKRIFVPFSAPEDLLEVEIEKDHPTWAEARITSIIEPSHCRVKPRCEVFGSCGGCQWQHISYGAQLTCKRAILAESIERIGCIENPDVLDTEASPEIWHYRNRIQLHVDSKGRIGFYRPKSNEVVEFKRCLIAGEELNLQLNQRREELKGRDRGVSLRMGDSPSFSQVNSRQNERLKEILLGWLSQVPHQTVLELYAGAGNFTFAIAGIADRVIASDVDGRAVREALRLRDGLGAANVEFVRAPSGAAARRMRRGCDVAVLDPPRKGCADAIPDLISAGPAAILYVSCDPATLARDIRELVKSGYRFVKALPVDMFPQTFHVETLALLERIRA